MRNKLLFAMLAPAVIWFTACNKNNDGPMIAPQELSKTYGTTEAALTVTYSGEPIIGKTVKFSTDDSQMATITLMDIVPGQAQTVIGNVRLTEANGSYAFSGSTSDGAMVSYSGSVNETDLKLDLIVTMPQNKWMKTYALSPLTKGDENYWIFSRKGLKPPYTYTLKEMVRTGTVLTAAGYVAISHFLPPAGSTVQDTIDACNITTFTDKFRSALGCMLPQVLKTVSLESDGNVSAQYSSDPVTFEQSYLINPQGIEPETITALTEGRTWLQSPKNLAHWYEKDGKIYIKLNLAAIVSQAAGAGGSSYAGVINMVLNSNAAGIKGLLKSMNTDITNALAEVSDETFTVVLGWMRDGIPVEAAVEGGHTHLYLDRETLDPIIKEVPALLPLLENLIPVESRDMAMSTINNVLKGYRFTTRFGIGLDLTAQ